MMRRFYLILFLFLIVSSNDLLSQNDPFKWSRLPNNSEINHALKVLVKNLGGEISVNGEVIDNQTVSLSPITKSHNKDFAGKLAPGEISSLNVFAEVKGIMGSFFYTCLLSEKGKGDFFFIYSTPTGKKFNTLNGYYNNLRTSISQTQNWELGFAPELEGGSNSSNDEDDGLWKVVIGAAAIGAAIVAIRKRLKNSKKKKGEKEKFKYILQVGDDSFKLIENEPQFLFIQAWKITEKGKLPTKASIRIQNSEKALSILPFSGIGRLKSKLLLKGKPSNEEFTITVNASIDNKSIQKIIKIKTGGENKIIINTLPNNTRSLRPNIDQTISCFAQVVDFNNKPLDELTKEIKFNPSQSKWIDLSDPVLDDGWIAINIGASDPDAIAAVSHPPKSVTLGITMEDVKKDEPILQNNLEIQLLDCLLETDLEALTFPVSGEKSKVKCKAYIENCPGDIPWKFKAIYMKSFEIPDEQPLTEVAIEEVSETKVNITLTGPIIEPKKGEKFLRKLFVISAQQKDETPLETYVYIMVSKEGLFIEKGVTKNNEIAFLAKGDFKKEIEFSLNWYNPETDKMEVNKKALKNLTFELANDNKIEKNIATVLEPTIHFEKFITTMHHGYYRLEVPNKFPGYGDIYDLNYLVKAPVTNTENPTAFEQIITLKVQSYGMGDKFPAWEKAYKDCKNTIYDYFKDSQERKKLLNMLERNKHKLDIEGMVEFRKKVWMIAHDLMINEAERYISEANSYDAIIDTLEWVVWMGDMAFQIVISTYMGPFAGFGASTFKEIAITGYTMVIEEKSVDEFIDAQIASFKEVLFSVAQGGIINTRNIGKIYKGNKIKVWAIYAVATFAIAYKRTGSIPEAAKMTGRQLRDELIITFLNGQVQKGQARLKAENEKKIETKKNPKERTTDKDQKGTRDYENDPNPPDVSGYTSSSIKSIQRIANKFKVKILTRPTNAAARRLLKSGQAVPKKQFVKNKTINNLDTYLGASKKNIGKVGTFKPKLNKAQLKKMPKEKVKAIVKRYKKRRREWNNQKEHIKASIKKGEIIVKDGLICNKDGIPFTGDIDIFDIRGANGEKLPPERIIKIINELKKSNIKTNIEHGAHVEWDWKSIKDPNDRKTAKGIYDNIINAHTKDGSKSIAKNIAEGKESLVQFEPGKSKGVKIKSVLYKG